MLPEVSQEFPGQLVILANQAEQLLPIVSSHFLMEFWYRTCIWSSCHISLDIEDTTLNDEKPFQKQLTYCLQRGTLINSLPFYFSSSTLTFLVGFPKKKGVLLSESTSVIKHVNNVPSTATWSLHSRTVSMLKNETAKNVLSKIGTTTNYISTKA